MDNSAGIILLVLRIGLTLTLFAFLYFSLKIIWKDLTNTAKSESLKIIPAIHFSILSGEPNTKSFYIEEIIIGRDPNCEFQISDPTISSKHVRVSYSQDQWWVEDLGSSNGTFLNEILVSTPAVLTQGDQLRLGKILIDIKISNI